jgi:hypothetical protein
MKPSDSPGKVLCDRTGHDKARDERAAKREADAKKAEAKSVKKDEPKKETVVADKPAPNLMDKARKMLKGPSGE